MGPLHREPFGRGYRYRQQRIGNRRFGSALCAPFAHRFAGPNHRCAHSLMIGSNVREVEIDEALFDHQVSNAGDAQAKHLIGHRESVSEGVSSRRDKRHKRCQSPQPLVQAPEPRPDVGGAREAITPASHVGGGGELNQRPLSQQAAKR
jgi:hypothetical protein